jgi:tRNA dimethylallyltransferase
VLSGAASELERAGLEHRLLGFVPVDGEFSAGRYATLAHAEIDQLIAEGCRPLVVGGTGLYLIAALSDLDLRPPVPVALREEVESEIAERGPEALHAELPPDLAATVHANDRKRVARLTELTRAGIDPPRSSENLWINTLRHPTSVFGLTLDRDELDARIDARVEAMVAGGAGEEVRAAVEAGASRTVRAAIGFEELLAGDVEAMKTAQRRFARRQLTWMRKMSGVTTIDRSARDDADVAAEIAAILDR